MMSKINPSTIDMYQVAFGQEEALYAQQICKKIQQRAVKRVVNKSFVKSISQKEEKNTQQEFEFNKGNDNRFKTEVNNQQDFFERSKSNSRERPTAASFVNTTQKSPGDNNNEGGSDDSDWGLEDESPKKEEKKGIMKQDGMHGLSLKLDPNELIKR